MWGGALVGKWVGRGLVLRFVVLHFVVLRVVPFVVGVMLHLVAVVAKVAGAKAMPIIWPIAWPRPWV